MGCKSSKVKKPQRDEAKELEEKERLEREAQAKKEEEEAARRKKEEEDALAAAEAAAKAEKEAAEAAAAAKAAADEEAALEEARLRESKEPEPIEQEPTDLLQPDEIGSIGTMSVGQEASSAAYPKEEVYKEPIEQITVASHAGAAILTARSVTPCDMTVVDQIAKYVSIQCGCDLGPVHDENMCPICRNMDLSDAPLLN